MRILLISFLFICSQTLSIAENIKEFEIDGMSVGDSLLKYYSKSEINKQLLKTSNAYKSDIIKRVFFMAKKEVTP